MEIKSKIEEKIPIQGNNFSVSGNNKINNKKSFSFNSDSSDFEAMLQELDENPKPVIEANNNVPTNLQATVPQEKTNEITKILKISDNTNNIPVKIDRLNDIKLFINKKRFAGFDDGAKINLDHLKKEDIDFLKTCLENPSITLNNVNFQNIQPTFAVQNQSGQVSYKSFDVSKGLFNLIEYSFKAQKPVRLDFNGNSSVILKMNNDGKLIAEFISNDKAMEYVLKSSIPNLKDKLDAEGIPYEKISYKDNSQNKNKRQNKGGNQ